MIKQEEFFLYIPQQLGHVTLFNRFQRVAAPSATTDTGATTADSTKNNDNDNNNNNVNASSTKRCVDEVVLLDICDMNVVTEHTFEGRIVARHRLVHPIDVALQWIMTSDANRPVHAVSLTLGSIVLSLNDAQAIRICSFYRLRMTLTKLIVFLGGFFLL